MLELTQTQMNTLVAIIGENEDIIRKYYEKLRCKYPNGTMTLAAFVEANNNKSRKNESRIGELLKFLFDTIDHDHSGTIDIYEHLLAMGLFGNPRNDQDVTIKYLFQLCDSNHDGLLTKEEIAKIVHIFVLKLQICSENRKADPKIYGERVMGIINKSFGDKAQLSEEEFRRVFMENEDIQELAQVAQCVLVSGLHVLSRPDDYDSD